MGSSRQHAPHHAEAATGHVAAIDIGGTKIAGGLVDAAGRVLRGTVRETPAPVSFASAASTAAPAGAAADGVMAAVSEILDELSAAPEWDEVTAIGIGSAGPVDVERGTVSPVNIPAWREFPLVARTAEHPAVGGRPLTLAGDAVAMAAGEHLHGAAAGCANALCMVVSTGVGGGLILNGRLIDGSTGNAGHIGHVLVHPDEDPAEARCQCGAVGCLEAVASGPRLSAWAVRRGWRADAPDDRRTGRDLVEDARSGDAIALSALARAGRALGIAIASATVLCDLELAAIGGGLAEAGPLLFDPLRESLRERVGLGFAQQIRAVPAALGRDVGLVGAAGLIYRSDRYWAAD